MVYDGQGFWLCTTHLTARMEQLATPGPLLARVPFGQKVYEAKYVECMTEKGYTFKH